MGLYAFVLTSMVVLRYGAVHVIETVEKYKSSQRTSKGTEKWLHCEKWRSTEVCFKSLKDRGYRIAVSFVCLCQVYHERPSWHGLGSVISELEL